MKFHFSLLPLTIAAISSAAGAVTLPTPNCPADVRCRFSDSQSTYGTIGSGAPLYTGGFTDRVGSGFVDEAENALYIPFEAGGQVDAYGAVIRVDLRTGNRTVISGQTDEFDARGSGVSYVSDRGDQVTGWNLGNIYAVRPGPSGTLYALVDKLGQERTEIFRIDKNTGNRTLVWASKLADDASHSSKQDSIQNIEARLGIIPANLCDRVKPFISFEVDPRNGDLLMASKVGLARVKPGGACRWVSRWDDQAVGSGPKFVTNVVTTSALVDRTYAFVSGPGNTSLNLVDIDTGEREILSQLNEQVPARSVGKGQYYIGFLGGLAFSEDFFLSSGYTNERGFLSTAVNGEGERFLLDATSGPLTGGSERNVGIVAGLPGGKFVVWYARSLHIFDAQSGESFTLSR